MKCDIFICYRKSDTQTDAKKIKKDLSKVFIKNHIFLDDESIPAGSKWEEKIENAIKECYVFLIVIDKNWTQSLNGKEDDFLPKEINWALKYGKKIIPVLVKDSKLPEQKNVPKNIQDFLLNQEIKLNNNYWDSDFKKLLEVLNQEKIPKNKLIIITVTTILILGFFIILILMLSKPKQISFLVYLNNYPVSNAQVKYIEQKIEDTSDSKGFVEFKTKKITDSISFQFVSSENHLDTTLKYSSKQVPDTINIFVKAPSINPKTSNKKIPVTIVPHIPILQTVFFESYTHSNPKYYYTSVSIELKDSLDNTIALIHNSDTIDYSNGSKHLIQLKIIKPTNKINCRSLKAKIFIESNRQNWSEKWMFNAKMLLNFSDGDSLSFNENNIILEDGRNSRFHTFTQ